MSDTTITATVIKDSLNVDYGSRLTTMVIRFPRCILPQVLTHRAFSRNTSSSRAIPTSKLLDRDPWIPSKVGINKPGMSAEKYLEGQDLYDLQSELGELYDTMSETISRLGSVYKVHKQTLNRYLEPWLMTTMLVSATEWDNFFALRLHHTTQPEMQELAQRMKEALDASTPQELKSGDWHVPFEQDDDFQKLAVAVGRCARVSYETHDGVRDQQKDIELFDKLKKEGHWSPFEHVAQAYWDKDIEYANLKGWIQYRTMLEESR